MFSVQEESQGIAAQQGWLCSSSLGWFLLNKPEESRACSSSEHSGAAAAGPGWMMQIRLLEEELSLPLCLVMKLYTCSVHFN